MRTCAFVGKLRLTDVENKDRIDLLERLKGTTEEEEEKTIARLVGKPV